MWREGQKLYTFIELPVFMRQLETRASLETLYAIQADLLSDPERWLVIKGTGSARKGRIAERARAERCGAEVADHCQASSRSIALLTKLSNSPRGCRYA
jgi:hypothetical protein